MDNFVCAGIQKISVTLSSGYIVLKILKIMAGLLLINVYLAKGRLSDKERLKCYKIWD
jgi:hypothetical protein